MLMQHQHQIIMIWCIMDDASASSWEKWLYDLNSQKRCSAGDISARFHGEPAILSWACSCQHMGADDHSSPGALKPQVIIIIIIAVASTPPNMLLITGQIKCHITLAQSWINLCWSHALDYWSLCWSCLKPLPIGDIYNAPLGGGYPRRGTWPLLTLKLLGRFSKFKLRFSL